ELLAQEGGALIHDVLADAASGHDHHERLRLGITRFVRACFERSDVARLLIVESVGLSEGVEAVRRGLQASFADAVAEEVRRARATRIKAPPAACSDRSLSRSLTPAPNRRPSWAAANAWMAIQITVRTIESPSRPALSPIVSSSTLMPRPRSTMARPRAWASK